MWEPSTYGLHLIIRYFHGVKHIRLVLHQISFIKHCIIIILLVSRWMKSVICIEIEQTTKPGKKLNRIIKALLEKRKILSNTNTLALYTYIKGRVTQPKKFLNELAWIQNTQKSTTEGLWRPWQITAVWTYEAWQKVYWSAAQTGGWNTEDVEKNAK